MSPPSRGRGSKHPVKPHGQACLLVAPFTGAWIETFKIVIDLRVMRVAPFTGAWIETIYMERVKRDFSVAPFTGAWIETPAISG